MPDAPQVSVVIPVHNEQDDVSELTASLKAILDSTDEIIFVDDGSTDSTWEVLAPLHQPGRVRLVKFRKNFGKTSALAAGFASSRGGIVITMDGDLQDDPTEIPRFLKKLEEGYDLVVGWKKTRHDPWHKVGPSRIFNSMVRKVTGLSLHDVNCGFKAYRGDLARGLRIYGEMHRFIPVLVAAEGFRVAELEVTHHPRRHGRSKYGFSRLFKGFFDLVTVILVTRFKEKPSHAFGFAALGFIAAGFLCAVVQFLTGEQLPLDILTAVLWVGGIVLFAAGWIAEISVAHNIRSSDIPRYAIEEQLD